MEWRKSSRSSSGGNCVEVRQDRLALRDSKSPVSVLVTPAVAGLLESVKAGRLTRR